MIVSPFSAKNSTEEDVQRISKVCQNHELQYQYTHKLSHSILAAIHTFDRDNTKGTARNDKLGASCGTLVTLISFPSMGSH